MLRTAAILIARMGSSRLAGKSLAPVAGKPLVVHLLERLQAVEEIDEVVLATPDLPQDRPLQEVGRDFGASVFVGASDDVLDRLYQAARAQDADVVVHLGGDCPFVGPRLVQQMLALFRNSGVDFACNNLPVTFPSGYDLEVISFTALERIWKAAKLHTTRHHVFSYLYQNPGEFTMKCLTREPALGHLRWTLDCPEDLEFVRAVYERLYPSDPYFGLQEVINLLEREPALAEINAEVGVYTQGQPVYWDSEGYMQDVRIDLRTVVEGAIAADEAGDLARAAHQYGLAQRLLQDLADRAAALSA